MNDANSNSTPLSVTAHQAQYLVKNYIENEESSPLSPQLQELVKDLDFTSQRKVLKCTVDALAYGDPIDIEEIEDSSPISELVEGITHASFNRCLDNLAEELNIQRGSEAYKALIDLSSENKDALQDKAFKKECLAVLVASLLKTYDSL